MASQITPRIYPAFLLLVCWFAIGTKAVTQSQGPGNGHIDLTVTDQNGQPLGSVIVTLQQKGRTVFQESTTPSGHLMRHVPAGPYRVIVRRQGFYTATVEKVEVPANATMPVEVRLQPVREYRQEVQVTAKSTPIDPEQTASSQSLTVEDIATIPYPTTRDYRNVLPYIPGVIADRGGQIHVGGSSTQQIQDYLDGFEVSQPASGSLSLRVNPDSLRKIDVRSSRYSAQFGKGSGGLTDLELQDGDNRFRFNATDFFPTFQNVKGIHLNNWTPRAYFSGPLVRNKAWFELSHEGETDLDIVKQLPDGQDTTYQWRIDDMARLRFNLTPANVLTVSTLVNVSDVTDGGLTPFDPVAVSTNSHSSLYLFTLKDQFTIARGTLLEIGTGLHYSAGTFEPHGFEDYIVQPLIRQGNYYLHNESWSSRSQAFTNLYLRPWKWMGKHQFTIGGRVDRVIYDGGTFRTPIQFQDINAVPLRTITFNNAPHFSLTTLESSAYAQDRWTFFDRITVEPGIRWDRDSFLQQDVFSPRLAGTGVVAPKSETKISAGVGVYYDRSNLVEYAQSLQGARVDQFLSPALLAIPASFVAVPQSLTLPRFVNWSAGLERRLPGRVYARLEFLSRHGENVWAYEPLPNGAFALGHNKQDKYDSAQITVRKEFKAGYPFVFSYTRSNARSNQSVDFGIDSFTTGQQAGGPLPWDAPNQITSWGSTPLPSLWKFRKFDFAYSILWRTGFPFATVNEFGQIVNPPGLYRLPDFFSLNIAVDKKFTFHGYHWAARVGVDNITGSSNAAFVDNNVNSPTFLTFFGQGHRTFNGRIRFLGK